MVKKLDMREGGSAGFTDVLVRAEVEAWLEVEAAAEVVSGWK